MLEDHFDRRRPPPFSMEKAKMVMEECDRHVNFANPDVKSLEEVEDWEEKLSRFIIA